MAILLRGEGLRVAFGLRTIFDIDTIEIFDNDRIGLIGDNGAGKSTLLSVLHGECAPDGGVLRRFCKSAIVRQFGAEEGERDAALEKRFRAIDPRAGMSGGEVERLRLSRALATRAPLLLADEPTTNLDFDGIEQARRALLAHRGALVLVSHDRALLDAICTRIWEIEEGKLRVYPGNYSAFREAKARETDFARFEYEQYRAEQSRLRAAISGVKEASRGVKKAPSRMGNSEARLHKRAYTDTQKKLERSASALRSRLEGLEEKERPREEAKLRMSLTASAGVHSADAVRAEHLMLSAGGRALLTGASFTVPTGRRTVIVGPNGCGKTTLLRAIRDEIPGVRLSPGVSIGWFGQETLDTLDLSLTLEENVMRSSVLPRHDARTLMARMGLTARDMDKRAAVLSGGERAKAALARLMVSNATLLLLDEPGNHLDLRALEALEGMLAEFSGTLLLVTHDRRMIDRVADKLLLFENGTLVSFDGNLEGYEARRKPGIDIEIEASRLRMRMAETLSRMSAPKKGETREALEEAYAELARQLREVTK